MSAIVDIQGIKDQLAFTADIGTADDALLQRILDASLDYVERVLGYVIEDTFGSIGQDPVPASLVQAIYQLASHWYENREGQEGEPSAPDWVKAIITEFRNWTF